MDSSRSPEALKNLFYQNKFQDLLDFYRIVNDHSVEELYWIASAFYLTGNKEEAKRLFEQALSGGFRGSLALLASICHEDGQFEQAWELLKLLEPFDELSLWDRAIAYR